MARFRRGVGGLAAGGALRVGPPSAAQPLLPLLAQARLQGLRQQLRVVRTAVGQYQSRLNAIEAVIAIQLGVPPSSRPSAAYDTMTSAQASSTSDPAPPTAAPRVRSPGVSDRILFSIFRRLDYEDFTEGNYPRTRVVNEYLDDDEQVDRATVQTSYDRFLRTPVRIHAQRSDRDRGLDRDDDEEDEYRHSPPGPDDDEGIDDGGRTVHRMGIAKVAPGAPARRRASSRTRTSGTNARATAQKK